MQNIGAKLSLLVIRSHDVESSLAFYHALGMKFELGQHSSGPVHYSCDLGGLVIEIYPSRPGSSDEPGADDTMLGFTVASLERALAALLALGIEPKSAPRESAWGRWVNVTEPSGRMVQITEAVA